MNRREFLEKTSLFLAAGPAAAAVAGSAPLGPFAPKKRLWRADWTLQKIGRKILEARLLLNQYEAGSPSLSRLWLGIVGCVNSRTFLLFPPKTVLCADAEIEWTDNLVPALPAHADACHLVLTLAGNPKTYWAFNVEHGRYEPLRAYPEVDFESALARFVSS